MTVYTLKNERENPKTKNTLPSKDLIQIQWRNQKLYRQAKAKIIQDHQTNFRTNAKERHIQTESERMEKDIPCKWKSKESWSTNTHTRNN